VFIDESEQSLNFCQTFLNAVPYFIDVTGFQIIICRLSLGSVTLDVAMGTPCGFLQQLVSVQLDHKVPEMVALGQLSHRLVCTPDLETLLSSSNSKR